MRTINDMFQQMQLNFRIFLLFQIFLDSCRFSLTDHSQ